MREVCGAAVLRNQQHVIGLNLARRDFHSWRARRHTRHGEPPRVGSFSEQTLDVLDGYIADAVLGGPGSSYCSTVIDAGTSTASQGESLTAFH